MWLHLQFGSSVNVEPSLVVSNEQLAMIRYSQSCYIAIDIYPVRRPFRSTDQSCALPVVYGTALIRPSQPVHLVMPHRRSRKLKTASCNRSFSSNIPPMSRKRRSLHSLMSAFFSSSSSSSSSSPPRPTTPSPNIIRRTASAFALNQRPLGRKSSTLHVEPPTQINRIDPPNRSPPPSYLLDDDPFASHACPAHCTDTIPRDPPPLLGRRTMSSPANGRPAYLRPAFTRPSLPSLNSLSQKTVNTPKVRKGKVGARLPSEPWDIDESNESNCSILSDDQPSLDSDTEVVDFYTESDQESDPPRPFHHPPPLTRSTSSNSSFSSRMASPSLGPRTPWGSVDETQSFTSKKISDQSSYLPPLDDEQESDTYDSRSHRRWVIPHADWMVPGSPERTPTTTMFAAWDLLLAESQIQPSTSATTIRSPIHDALALERQQSRGEMLDGSEGNHRGQPSSWDSSFSGSGGGGSGAPTGSGGASGGSGDSNHPTSGGSGGDDDQGGDRRRQHNYRSAFSTPTESEESVEESEDTSTDDYGQESPSMLSFNRTPFAQDDDVPLAQRIPNALEAQRSIQKQVKDERDQRKKERAFRRQQQQSDPAAGFTGRPRTRTLPSSLISPTAIVDLTKRLLKVHDSTTTTPQRSRREEPPTKPSSSVKRPAVSGSEDREPRLKHVRSLHNLLRRDNPDPATPRSYGESKTQHTSGKTLPGDDMLGFNRLLGRSQTKSNEDGHQRFGFFASSSRPSTGSGRPSTSGSVGRSTTAVARPSTSAGRLTSSAGRSQLASLSRPSTSAGRLSTSTSRPSLADESRASADHQHQRPPVPQFRVVTQQRIFIGDMQSFQMVEIGASTSAGDVLRIVEEQSALDQYGGSSAGWMLWEMAQDFGMERPIRSFELLSDVSATWNKDKMVNMFLLKRTSLASVLARSAIPSSAPKHSGYVEWEVKRGKWSKRWLELREHCLWTSKRETTKAETLLCSLSTFDAYFVTRPYKSPKPFVFAVKSTDNISLFENTADFLHVFSCNQKECDKWMEMILLARSHVLQQERTILFSGSTASQGLQRANTRKSPGQPLVQVAAPYNTLPTSAPVFEPGSLLAQS